MIEPIIVTIPEDLFKTLGRAINDKVQTHQSDIATLKAKFADSFTYNFTSQSEALYKEILRHEVYNIWLGWIENDSLRVVDHMMSYVTNVGYELLNKPMVNGSNQLRNLTDLWYRDVQMETNRFYLHWLRRIDNALKTDYRTQALQAITATI